MLILRRFAGESIDIIVPPSTEPQTIKLTVTRLSSPEARRQTASIGIEAHESVKVYRDDIKNREA